MQDQREQSRKFVGNLNLDTQADFRRRFQQSHHHHGTVGSAALQTPTALPLQSPALSYDLMSGMNLIPANLLTPGIGYHNTQFNFGYPTPGAHPSALAGNTAPQSPTLTMDGTYPQESSSPLSSPTSAAQPAQYFRGVGEQATARTVYIGNLPDGVEAHEVISLVKTGPLESARLISDKNCAFITFIDCAGATLFHTDAQMRRPSLQGHEIKIGWGKPSFMHSTIRAAIQQTGATRNVYIGHLPPQTTVEAIRSDFERFGEIDTVKVVAEKNIGFVHFCNIRDAITAVQTLSEDQSWQARRVNYGKDRCAYVSKQQQTVFAQNQAILGSLGLTHVAGPVSAFATPHAGNPNAGNRTVYLGNIHQETTLEEICNVVRGGILHNIRYLPDKHICFVTFVDPNAAIAFYALSSMQGLIIHNRRLKIGWGKHSGPLPTSIALAVGAGASRNVYVGNIDETVTEEQLRVDFQEFGEIELVNTLREKNCAFINFTHLTSAIRAIEGIKQKDGYRDGPYKINFGKDRCGNPTRRLPNLPGTISAGIQIQHTPQYQQHQAAIAQLQNPGAPSGPSAPTNYGPMAAQLVAQQIHSPPPSNAVPTPTSPQEQQHSNDPSSPPPQPSAHYNPGPMHRQQQQPQQYSMMHYNQPQYYQDYSQQQQHHPHPHHHHHYQSYAPMHHQSPPAASKSGGDHHSGVDGAASMATQLQQVRLTTEDNPGGSTNPAAAATAAAATAANFVPRPLSQPDGVLAGGGGGAAGASTTPASATVAGSSSVAGSPKAVKDAAK